MSGSIPLTINPDPAQKHVDPVDPDPDSDLDPVDPDPDSDPDPPHW